MGLAGAKNKRRLGNDPNNTKWSRNTETFGQKLLRSQGWEPGQYLGAQGAAHAESYTEASTSHIRVTLKDDTLGLGAKRNNGDECTGLNAFQHLLGRLNGKSEDVLAAEEKKREDTKLSLYVERKLGRINFVRGGWLVGDTLKEEPKADAPDVKSESDDEEEESTEAAEPVETTATEEKKSSKKRKADDKDEEKAARKKEKKSKRRKTDPDEGDDAETDSEDPKDKKKDKKSKKRKTTESTDENADPTESSKSSKKSKKDKERQSAEESSEDVTDANSAEDAKKAKKEKKKEKKEKKEKRKKDKSPSDSGAEDKKEKKRRKKEKEASESTAASGVSTPTEGGSGYSTPTVTTNTRYLARSRFIAQKKMAFADTAALNQIFMIKS
ncbi:protein PXR1 [Podospora australis]|uniref:PinX1-related protein 1 n=1 Tax=Podospora australis TaxID=1536484 RepID=A0AAN7AK63_9PEZI|nr:protein PXR1 [Podospora australis]